MTSDVKVYKIFVSSPSDIKADRKIVKSAVLEASRLLNDSNIILKPWLWEDDATSEFGDSAQNLIMRQLGDYDFYIGLMGSTFGTATAHFGSGTEEEFYKALDEFTNGKLQRVGFFFKEVSIVTTELTAVKMAQISKVNEFRGKLQPLGLYQSFSSDSDLREKTIKFLIDGINAESRFAPKSTAGSQLDADAHSDIASSFKLDFLNAVDSELIDGETRVSLEDLWVDLDLIKYDSDSSNKEKRGK